MATKKNTSYKVSVDNVTESLMPSMNIEDGALCRTEDGLYMGHNGSMVKLYPQPATQLGLGWARIDDTVYTESNKLTLTDLNEIVMPNNAGNVVTSNGDSYYDAVNQKFVSTQANDVYILSVAFKASVSNTQNTHMDLMLSGFGEINRVEQVVSFYKGNNSTQNQHYVMQYYTDQDFVDNGMQVKIQSHGGSGKIWDIIYFIQKTQSYA